VDVLPSFQTVDEKDWSFGSADCVRRHYKAGSLRGPSFVEEPEAYLILSGEALYRMDYQEMLRTHNETGAGITIATVSRRIGDLDVTNLGVCGVAPTEAGTRARGEVFAFQERPSIEELQTVAVGSPDDATDPPLTDCDVHVNMGVYIFSKAAMDSLLGVIELCSERLDFGKDILPMAISSGVEVRAHLHEGYWQPIRNLREWYDANLSLCKTKSDEQNAMSMIDAEFPIYTVPRCLPPARFRGEVYSEGSIVSEGVVVGDGAVVVDSIVGPCVVLGEGVQVRGSIFIGHQETGYLHGDGAPDVGKNSVLKNCVVHSDVVIGEGCVLTNEAGVLEHNGVDIQSGKGYMIQRGTLSRREVAKKTASARRKKRDAASWSWFCFVAKCTTTTRVVV
jgi:glucose-1-phosphate adenylyltransferase